MSCLSNPKTEKTPQQCNIKKTLVIILKIEKSNEKRQWGN